MKLTEKDLMSIYESLPKEDQAKSKECPQVKFFLKAFFCELSERGKNAIVDHISNCRSCSQKFEAARQLVNETRDLAKDFEGVSLSEDEMRELRQRARFRVSELGLQLKTRNKPTFRDRLSAYLQPRIAWRYGAAVVGLLIIVSGTILFLRIYQTNLKDKLRGREESVLQLIAPRGGIKDFPAIFKWNPYSGAKEYIVTLLDEELTAIWTSEKTEGQRMGFPSELNRKIEKGKTYYWKLIIYLDNGESKESRLQDFRIKGN